MPVNLSAHNELLSDSDSDTSSSEYEIVGPPSRPSSWETYIDDGYISDREYVVPTPPPHHVTRRRRSLEERELVRQEAELVARLEQCRRGGSGGPPTRSAERGYPGPIIGADGAAGFPHGFEREPMGNQGRSNRLPEVSPPLDSGRPVYSRRNSFQDDEWYGPRRGSAQEEPVYGFSHESRRSTEPIGGGFGHGGRRATESITLPDGRILHPSHQPIVSGIQQQQLQHAHELQALQARHSQQEQSRRQHRGPPMRIPVPSQRQDIGPLGHHRGPPPRPIPDHGRGPALTPNVRYVGPRSPSFSSDGGFQISTRDSPTSYAYEDPTMLHRLHRAASPHPRPISSPHVTPRGAPAGAYRATAPIAPPLKLRDPAGRVYSFPFAQCKRWNDIQELIIGACGYLEDIGPAIMAGMYELWAPDGAVVHPDEWEETIRPGWALSLSLVDPRVPRPTNWRERPRAMRDDGEYLMGS